MSNDRYVIIIICAVFALLQMTIVSKARRVGVTDVLTSDYRQRAKGQDYKLTFLAAANVRERLGIARFALVPPLGQLRAKYDVRQPWLGPLLYPRHLAERLRDYGKAFVARSRP